MEAGKAAGKETLNAGKRQMEVLKAIGKQVRTRAMSAQADVRTRVSEAGASGEALRA